MRGRPSATQDEANPADINDVPMTSDSAATTPAPTDSDAIEESEVDPASGLSTPAGI